jgi:hypothetical protein
MPASSAQILYEPGTVKSGPRAEKESGIGCERRPCGPGSSRALGARMQTRIGGA